MFHNTPNLLYSTGISVVVSGLSTFDVNILGEFMFTGL